MEESLKLLLNQAALAASDGQSQQDSLAAQMASPQLLDNQLINSSEFRMYCFKILPCTRRYGHDWTACPFAHPGEKATRRCPQRHSYVPLACPDIKKTGSCPRRETCTYAHNIFEFWCHPLRFRTQLCSYASDCKRPICFFAHSYNELRVVDQALLQELEKQMDLLGEGAAFGFPPSNKKHGRDSGTGEFASRSPREGGSTPRDSFTGTTPPHLTPRVSRTTEELVGSAAGGKEESKSQEGEMAGTGTPHAVPPPIRTLVSPPHSREASRTLPSPSGTSTPTASNAASAATTGEAVRSTTSEATATPGGSFSMDSTTSGKQAPGNDASSPAALQLLQLQLQAQKQRQASTQALQAMERQYSSVKLHAAAALLGIDVSYLAQALYSTPPPPARTQLSPQQVKLLQAMVQMAASPAANSQAGVPAGYPQDANPGNNPSLGGWVATNNAGGMTVQQGAPQLVVTEVVNPAQLTAMLGDQMGQMNVMGRQAAGSPAAGLMLRSRSTPSEGLQAMTVDPTAGFGNVAGMMPTVTSTQGTLPSPLPSLAADQDQMAATLKLLAELSHGSSPASQVMQLEQQWSNQQQQQQQQLVTQHLMQQSNAAANQNQRLVISNSTPTLVGVNMAGVTTNDLSGLSPQDWQNLLAQLGNQSSPGVVPTHASGHQAPDMPTSTMHMPSMSTLANEGASLMVQPLTTGMPASDVDLTSSPFGPSPAAVAAATAAIGFDARSAVQQQPAPLTLQARAQAGALVGLMNKGKPGVAPPAAAANMQRVVMTMSGNSGSFTAPEPQPMAVPSLLPSQRSTATSGPASTAGSDDSRGANRPVTNPAEDGHVEARDLVSHPEYAGAGRLVDTLSELVGEDAAPSPARTSFDMGNVFQLGAHSATQDATTASHIRRLSQEHQGLWSPK